MSRPGERHFRKLRLRSGVTAVLVLLVGLVAAAAAYRRPIAEYLLMDQLRKLGLERVEFSVGRLDTGLLEIQNLRIGEGGNLEIASIEARFSITGLFGSRLDALQISGARVRGTYDDSGLSFGDLDALLTTSEQQTRSSGPTALPASGIDVDDARLQLETEAGPLDVRLSVRVLQAASGQLEGSATLSAEHPQANLTIELNAAGRPSSLTGDLKLEAAATGELGAQITAEGVTVSANAEFSFEEGAIAIRSNECAAIHIDTLSVQGLVSLAKPLDLCLRLRDDRAIRYSLGGALEAFLELEPAAIAVDVQSGTELLRISGELPAIKARFSAAESPLEVAIETEAGQLELSNPEVGMRGMALATHVSLETTAPSVSLHIEEIFDLHQPPRLPNLSLVAQLEPNDSAVDFEIQLADADRKLVLDISGSHDLSSGAGRAVMKMEPIDFLPGGVQPVDLLPAHAGVITEASGSLSIAGLADWRPDETRAQFKVTTSDLSVASEMGSVEKLNAVIEIGSDGIVTIESASWEFAGGTLTTAGTIDTLASKQELTVLVKEIDLAALVTMVNLDGLSGSGTLSGELPIFREGDEIEIRKAKIRSVGQGDVIRYRPEASVASVGVADSQFAMALSVLENFQYEQIEIEIDGAPSGQGTIQIHLKGSNPDYQNGHAVAFNLSVEAALSEILRAQTIFYEIPDLIEERIRALAERHP